MLSLNRLVAKNFGKLPLQNVLVVSVVLQIFAVVGIVGYLSWRNGQKTINDLSIQLQSQISSRIYLQLENYLQMSHRLNQTNAIAIEQDLLKPSDLGGLERFFLKQMHTFELVPYTAKIWNTALSNVLLNSKQLTKNSKHFPILSPTICDRHCDRLMALVKYC